MSVVESSCSSMSSSPNSPGKSSGEGAKTLLRLLALLVGCVAVGMSYLVNAFNIFAIALKKKFILSQIQLEVLLSLLFLGLCASLPGGMLLDKAGSRWTAALAMCVSTSGFTLIWMATLFPDFHNEHFYLLAIYFLIAGIGGGLTYITGTASNVRNFSSRVRATVMGVIHASMSTGPALLMLVYNSHYMKGHIIDEENQDVGGFMVFVAIAFFTVNLLGLLVYDYYPPSDVSGETTPLIKAPKSTKKAPAPRETFHNADILAVSIEVDPRMAKQMEQAPPGDVGSGISVLFTKDYQLLLWPSIILAGLQMMFVQNLTTVLATFGQKEYNTVYPYVTPIVGTLVKPMVGLISDLSVKYMPRAYFILLGACCDLLMMFLCIFAIDHLTVVLVVTIFIDITVCIVFSLVPTLIVEKFGLKDFPRNWGLVFGGFAILTGVLVIMFGVVYDAHVKKGADECSGLQCFQWTFIVSTLLSFIALICISAFLYFESKKKKRDKLAKEAAKKIPKFVLYQPKGQPKSPILRLKSEVTQPKSPLLRLKSEATQFISSFENPRNS